MDAETFGPAMMLLHDMQPDRVMMNLDSDPVIEQAKWADLPERVRTARGRLLAIGTGHPRRQIRRLAMNAEVSIRHVNRDMHLQLRDMLANRDNPGWVEIYRKEYAEAEAAMDELIAASFQRDWPWKGRSWRRSWKQELGYSLFRFKTTDEDGT